MDWLQILTIIIANFGLFLWLRTESRSDYRHMEARTDAILNAIKDDMKDFHYKYMEETKNFHGRLCSLEERRK